MARTRWSRRTAKILRTRKTPVAFLATGKFWVNNHAHILRGTNATYVRYLAHRIEAADVSGYLTGSTQPKLTQQALLSMVFPWPPLAVQRAVAEIVGRLHDKIVVNDRIIAKCAELGAAFSAELPLHGRYSAKLQR
jgi:type I restriction enzyme, S subunit